MTPTLLTPQRGSAPSVPVAQPNPMQNVALTLLSAELFVGYTRIFDNFLVGFHIPAAVLLMLLFASMGSGALFRGINTKSGHIMVALTAWITVTLPFSIWKSGSIPSYIGILE